MISFCLRESGKLIICLSDKNINEGDMQNQLSHAIQGRGAFRRFKDSVNRMGIAK